MKTDTELLPGTKIIFDETKLHGSANPIYGILDDNGCVNCTSHKFDEKRYCEAKRNNVREKIHRLLFQKYCREIGEGDVVRHKCDNRRCINPDHLEDGTPQDNTNDMIERGRNAKGSKCGTSKLDEYQVFNIKFISNKSPVELSIEFNVHTATIRAIIKGRSWKWLTEDMIQYAERKNTAA